MTKNPLINALAALVYIALVATVMTVGSQLGNAGSAGDSPIARFLAPVAMISLFTLSAAVMGYLFLYQPAQLYFADKKKTAVDLFLKTVGVFGAITMALLLLLFSGLLS